MARWCVHSAPHPAHDPTAADLPFLSCASPPQEPEEFLDIMERRARLDAQRAASKRGGDASGLGHMLRSYWAQLAGDDSH
jgi:hypothetical protein